jgi:NADPH:quinone reductase-like Zn-dependent oxidoreductase
MGREARAYWTVGRERGELRSEALAEPGPAQVLVEALHSGISRGTELLVHRGLVPESEHERMRAPHQAGRFPWPVKYGYCSVGRVAEGPRELRGREVFCLYPHQDAYVIEAAAVALLPDGVPAARAVLGANMETALNAVWDAGVSAGDRIAVVGAGVVGSLVAYLGARHPGCEVELIDVDAGKSEVARALGVDFALPSRARAGVDLVVHASGSPAGLETALALAGAEATVLELSWYGTQRATLSLGEAFHPLRLQLKSSQVGSLPPRQRPRWTHRRRLEVALRLLRDARLDRLIDASVRFEQLPEVMLQLAKGELSALCCRVDY